MLNFPNLSIIHADCCGTITTPCHQKLIRILEDKEGDKEDDKDRNKRRTRTRTRTRKRWRWWRWRWGGSEQGLAEGLVAKQIEELRSEIDFENARLLDERV